MNIETIKKMVEALEKAKRQCHYYNVPPHGAYDDAIQAGRQAIAEAEKQEPVAIVVASQYEDGSHAGNHLEWRGRNEANDFPEGTAFYTHPQPKAEKQEPVSEAHLCVMVGYSKANGGYFVYEETTPQEFCAIKGPFASRLEAETAMRDQNAELINPQPAQPAPDMAYSIDSDPSGIRKRAADAIIGALALGAQDLSPPPEGHWLQQFWNIGRAEASKTTPQPPQPKQEQGEPVANSSAWFALVMNAAAELEDASNCLRDEDAKRAAIRGAKYYRDAANTLYTKPQPSQKPLTDARKSAALTILAGFCANPSVFAHNSQFGWGLVNCSDKQLCEYALSLSDELDSAIEVSQGIKE